MGDFDNDQLKEIICTALKSGDLEIKDVGTFLTEKLIKLYGALETIISFNLKTDDGIKETFLRVIEKVGDMDEEIDYDDLISFLEDHIGDLEEYVD